MIVYLLRSRVSYFFCFIHQVKCCLDQELNDFIHTELNINYLIQHATGDPKKSCFLPGVINDAMITTLVCLKMQAIPDDIHAMIRIAFLWVLKIIH